jgi:hypothetical protein
MRGLKSLKLKKISEKELRDLAAEHTEIFERIKSRMNEDRKMKLTGGEGDLQG